MVRWMYRILPRMTAFVGPPTPWPSRDSSGNFEPATAGSAAGMRGKCVCFNRGFTFHEKQTVQSYKHIF